MVSVYQLEKSPIFEASNRKCAIIESKYLHNYASVLGHLYYIQRQKEKYDSVQYSLIDDCNSLCQLLFHF